MSSPIICAGFHRSGTSLASQIIHLSGVPFALEIMHGNISNPDGHFEDIVARRMHDEFLSESGSSWQFHAECKINHGSAVAKRIKNYSDCRYQVDGPTWLMKDPRATLYLEDWQAALNGNGKFVLFYRHWGLCIQSLLKRHSKNLAYDLPTSKALSEHIAFWKNPELAARMWLAYNNAMIKFIKANRENCLLVSQTALIQGYDLITGINDKFETQLEPIKASPVKAEYASESIDVAILKSLSAQLQSELNDTYYQLGQLCNTDHSEYIPDFFKESINKKTISLITDGIHIAEDLKEKKIITKNEASSIDKIKSETDLKNLSLEQLKKHLHGLKSLTDKENARRSLPYAVRLVELEPLNISGHEWLGRIHTALGQDKEAERSLIKAISLGNTPPYIKMLLGDVYLLRYQLDLSEYHYLLATKEDPKNPVFLVKLADLYFIKKSYNKSINYYKASLEIDNSDRVKLKLINTDELLNGSDSAIALSKNILKNNKSKLINNKLTSLKLKLDSNSAKDKYKSLVKDAVTRPRIFSFLSRIKYEKLENSKLEQLIYWLSLNWDDLYNSNEFNNLLIPQEGESPANPKLSIIVISYNMDRELPRTIASLLPTYQQDVSEEDIEIIIIDNGSKTTPVLSDFHDNNNIRILSNSSNSVSPVSAINLGLSLAKADLVGVLIDGARMASPGLYKHVLKANRLSDRAIVSTLGFHLGPEVQMRSVRKGYNQNIEDLLLEKIDWINNGYDLFSISSLAGSSANGYFQPISESNAIFMSKNLWQELGGYDEQFKTPGGGYTNLDTYRRACELDNTDLIVLMNEGTFHQVHGGVATNLQREDATPKIFQDEYISIRGQSFSPPDKPPIYIGSHVPQANSFLQFSIDNVKNISNDINSTRNTLNSILLKKSYCKPFPTDTSIPKNIIDSPIIITGRGGSGTRLLSKLMQGIDIFLGNEINETEDSIEWVGPIYDLVVNRRSFKNGDFNEKHINRLRENAKNILTINKFSSGSWGFKLPETMLCLPELLAAFPNAQFIHLVRHPISISMRRSHMTSRFNNAIGKTVLQNAYAHFNVDIKTIPDKKEYFNNAISWAYQLQLVIDGLKNTEFKRRCLHVKYEEIINDPSNLLDKILKFLNMSPQSTPDLNIDIGRTNLHSFPPLETEEVWELCKNQAISFEYIKEVGDII